MTISKYNVEKEPVVLQGGGASGGRQPGGAGLRRTLTYFE